MSEDGGRADLGGETRFALRRARGDPRLRRVQRSICGLPAFAGPPTPARCRIRGTSTSILHAVLRVIAASSLAPSSGSVLRGTGCGLHERVGNAYAWLADREVP